MMRFRTHIVLLIAMAVCLQGCTALLGGGKKRPTTSASLTTDLNKDHQHGN